MHLNNPLSISFLYSFSLPRSSTLSIYSYAPFDSLLSRMTHVNFMQNFPFFLSMFFSYIFLTFSSTPQSSFISSSLLDTHTSHFFKDPFCVSWILSHCLTFLHHSFLYQFFLSPFWSSYLINTSSFLSSSAPSFPRPRSWNLSFLYQIGDVTLSFLITLFYYYCS